MGNDSFGNDSNLDRSDRSPNQLLENDLPLANSGGARSRAWQFAIDVGGTFTDCLATDPSGNTRRLKILSSAAIRSAAIPDSRDPTQFQLQLPLATVDGQFVGFSCRLFDLAGRLVSQSHVDSWDSQNQRLVLADPMDSADAGIATVQLFSEMSAPELAIRLLMGLRPDQPIDGIHLRLGTTRGTNALLTRNGAKTAFLTTTGFRDALLIGTQQRPDLFAVDVVKPTPLYTHAAEVSQRINADGEIQLPIAEDDARRIFENWKSDGVQSVAISLLHGYANTDHENRLAEIAGQYGFANITVSHKASPLVKFIPRSSTAVLDAYLNPILQNYVDSIRHAIGPGSQMWMMTSSGGLVAPEDFSGKDSILSGPAGGVVGFAHAAGLAGYDRAIGFDMGGTSTDVSRLDGDVSLQNETRKAGVEIQTPCLAIETVAAGGGSICGYTGGRLTVGPQSAGADPGPACYGLGGPLTVTDLNVWLGRVPQDRFPFPLQRSAVQSHLESLAAEIKSDSGVDYDLDQLALALIEIANSHMASAVNTVTTRQGSDPADYVLVGFGGAAGQHLCGVADQLGISQILLHPDAGLLSAYGIGQARQSRTLERSLLLPLNATTIEQVRELSESLIALGKSELNASGVEHQIRLQICVSGTQQLLTQYLPFESIADWNADKIAAKFWSDFQQRFGYKQDRALEVQVLQVQVSQVANATDTADQCIEKIDQLQSKSSHVQQLVANEDGSSGVPVIDRQQLWKQEEVVGPLVIAEPHSTTFVAAGWTGRLIENGQLLLNKTAASNVATNSVNQAEDRAKTDVNQHNVSNSETACQPHRLELFHHRLTEIATQMGLMLRMTCTSVNVKERLDFSCAIFDAAGNLIVNAPHIPVHLGAMSETVRQTIRLNSKVTAGDHFVTNDPFQGGSHLPDVTVISPVFLSDEKNIQANDVGSQAISGPAFWVASRAHHAEIGGVTPGSMPPFSRNLAEEGVLLSNIRVNDQATAPWSEVRTRLSAGAYPSRNVDDNLLDLEAQLAANRKGSELLKDLAQQWTLPVTRAYAGFIQDAACHQVRQTLSQLPDGHRTFSDQLDCGLTIRLSATIKGEQLLLDFSGTDQPIGNNLNSNSAIVRSAVLYCLRLLLNTEFPLNDGVLRPIKIVLPKCFLNPLGEQGSDGIDPRELPAVVGGNVETSQRLVDVVLAALQLAAASQGTMNNFLFGDSTFGFYETIGGGTGATANANGADAVHSHMTNTRLTDPEILERRYPVQLTEFGIRYGSGGAGQQQGGNGMVRRFRFLRPLTVSLLANRRGELGQGELRQEDSTGEMSRIDTNANLPFGFDGGLAGKAGENWLIQPDGSRQRLVGCCQLEIEAGQEIEILTPGGGGWGTPNQP